jgi:hypothetical protein
MRYIFHFKKSSHRLFLLSNHLLIKKASHFGLQTGLITTYLIREISSILYISFNAVCGGLILFYYMHRLYINH